MDHPSTSARILTAKLFMEQAGGREREGTSDGDAELQRTDCRAERKSYHQLKACPLELYS
jgi:hypothetical protein